MDSTVGSPAPPGRLDPFAFPSETAARLLLLILLSVSTGLFAYQIVDLRPEAIRAAAERCLVAAPPPEGVEALQRRTAERNRCLAPFHEREALGMLAGGAVVLGGGLLFAAVHPRWRIWRRRLRPLTGRDPRLERAVAALCAEAGLRHGPRLYVAPLSTRAAAVAFGAPGRYRVALDAGLVLACERDPARFRAVVLHELGHLRNRDVGWTYFTLGCVVAVGVGVLPPFAATLAWRGFSWSWWLEAAARILVLAVLVWSSRVAVLRVREVYADARAMRCPEVEAGLRRELREQAPRPGRWRRWWSVHPQPALRQEALSDPERAVRPGPLEAFTAGVAAFVGRELVRFVVSLLATRLGNGFLAPLAASLVVGSVLAVVIVLPAWRAGTAAGVRGDRVRGVHLLALATALGGGAGRALSLFGVYEGSAASFAPARLLEAAGWMLLFYVGLDVLLHWTAATARGWARAGAGAGRPRWVWVSGIGIAVGALVLWIAAIDMLPADIAATAATVAVGGLTGSLFLPVLRGLSRLGDAAAPAMSVVVALTYGSPWAVAARILALGALSLFPFAIGPFAPSRTASAGAPAPPVTAAPARAPGPSLALTVAACTAGVLALIVAGLHLYVRSVVAPAAQAEIAFRLEFITVQIVAAALVQVPGALVVARREPAALHALLAVAVASALETGAITVLWRAVLHGQWFDLRFVCWLFDQIAVPAAVLCLAAAALRGLVRTLRQGRGGGARPVRPIAG